MARRLFRQIATIGTALLMAASPFVALGLWRRTGDAEWCRQAAAGGVPAGEKRLTPDVLDEVHSACVVQRQRQRSLFGAIWRTGGQEAARCGFELARLQLISYHDPAGHRAVLELYGVDDSGFEVSSREGQDRFVRACLSTSAHGPGR
jgi:hypothetical protein